MPLNILCITDPATHSRPDSTVELYRRLPADPRFVLHHLHPADVSSAEPAAVCPVPAGMSYEQFLRLGTERRSNIAWERFDLIINRADEPLPEGYLEHLIALEHRVRFAASPLGMVRAIGREFARGVAGAFLPDWIATRDHAEAARFIERHRVVVAKKERSYGGKGVFRVSAAGGGWEMQGALLGSRVFRSLSDLLDAVFEMDPLPFEFVRFLPRVVEGDKRILVLEGRIIGSFLRVTDHGGWLSTMELGARAVRAEVLSKEEEVIAATWPSYQQIDLPMLGYDFLTDDDGTTILSEINAGNVGGFELAEEAAAIPVFPIILDWIAARAESASR